MVWGVSSSGAVDLGEETLSTLTSSSIAVPTTVTPPSRLPAGAVAGAGSCASAVVAEAMKPTQESARKAGLARSLIGIQFPLFTSPPPVSAGWRWLAAIKSRSQRQAY